MGVALLRREEVCVVKTFKVAVIKSYMYLQLWVHQEDTIKISCVHR